MSGACIYRTRWKDAVSCWSREERCSSVVLCFIDGSSHYQTVATQCICSVAPLLNKVVLYLSQYLIMCKHAHAHRQQRQRRYSRNGHARCFVNNWVNKRFSLIGLLWEKKMDEPQPGKPVHGDVHTCTHAHAHARMHAWPALVWSLLLSPAKEGERRRRKTHTHTHTHLLVICNMCDASGWLIDTTDTKTSAVLALLPSLCLTVNSSSVNILYKKLFLHTVNCLCCPVYLFTCSNTYRIYNLGRRAFAVCVTE